MPRLSRLDGARVFDATGTCLGRVHDLRTRGGGGEAGAEVASVLYAGPGLHERLGLGRGRRDRVAWDAVERIGDAALWLKEGSARS
jgi:sporulation protein YlmC with PRC-barrel domain